MNKALLALGIAAVAIPAWNEVAVYGTNNLQSVTIPYFPGSETIGKYIGMTVLAIIGAILIIIAAFIPLG